MQIRAGWASALAKAARLTDVFSNASSFATGMDFIFQIWDIDASANFPAGEFFSRREHRPAVWDRIFQRLIPELLGGGRRDRRGEALRYNAWLGPA
jgi:hypothetical protein